MEEEERKRVDQERKEKESCFSCWKKTKKMKRKMKKLWRFLDQRLFRRAFSWIGVPFLDLLLVQESGDVAESGSVKPQQALSGDDDHVGLLGLVTLPILFFECNRNSLKRWP